MTVLKDYLVQEALDKRIPEADKQFCQDYQLKMPAYHPNVPKQTNGTDCGLFLLENVECFLENPAFVMNDLNQKKGELFRKRIVDEKREHMKRAIIAMTENTCSSVQNLGQKYCQFRSKMHGRKLHVPKGQPQENSPC